MYVQHFSFGYVLGARKNSPKPPRDTPEAPQEASEGAPGAPKGAQGLPRDVSKAPLGAPKAPQKHPVSTPRCGQRVNMRKITRPITKNALNRLNIAKNQAQTSLNVLNTELITSLS